jgi:hypothetical protein
MQDQHFDQLTEETAKRVADLIPLTERQKAFAEVKKVMAEARDNGMILSLSNDEVLLLTSYREWKIANTSGSPVFHWRKP